MDESEKDASVEQDRRSAEEDEQSEDAFPDILEDSDNGGKCSSCSAPSPLIADLDSSKDFLLSC